MAVAVKKPSNHDRYIEDLTLWQTFSCFFFRGVWKQRGVVKTARAAPEGPAFSVCCCARCFEPFQIRIWLSAACSISHHHARACATRFPEISGTYILSNFPYSLGMNDSRSSSQALFRCAICWLQLTTMHMNIQIRLSAVAQIAKSL